MSAEKILNDWKNKSFRPLYWLEGEEDYYIDQVVQYAEHSILPETEAAFNLTVFYGRDAQWSEVVNACMRYPMFAERQVVLLKEAQHMRDLAKLEPYIEKPLASTVLVVSYKEKKLDGRSRLARLVKEKGEWLSTKKMYDSALPEWVSNLVHSKGYGIQQKALMLIVDHIGNDLSRIDNEVEKLLLNIGSRKTITEDDVEKFVGVSKEYNAFELKSALASKDLSRVMKILNYFESNPKAAPIQWILPTLYGLFGKAYMIFGQKSRDEKAIAALLGINSYMAQDFITAARTYGYDGIERALLLLHHYNMRSVGVGDAGTSPGALMKELVYKITAEDPA